MNGINRAAAAAMAFAMALSATTFTNVGAANAAPADAYLSHDDFIASQGYQDLLALGALSHTAYDSMQGLEQVSTIHMTDGQTNNVDMVVNVKTNKTDSTSTTSISAMPGVPASTSKYYFSKGHYVFNAKTYAENAGDRFVQKALALLKKPSKSWVLTTSNQPPAGITDISPAAFTSSVSQDGLASLAIAKLSPVFTQVTCSPGDLSTQQCNYGVSAFVANVGKILIDVNLTFDETGFLSAMTLNESTDPTGFAMTLSMTQKPLNGWTQTLPSPVVSESKLTATSHRLAAERNSLLSANDVKASAVLTAKYAHKTLTLAQVKTLAHNMGQKFSPIKNGIKVTTKVGGVAGSACLVISNGKATSKVC